MLSGVLLKNQNEIEDLYFDKDFITPLKDDELSEIPICSPSLDIQSSQNPHILFIVADPTSLDPVYDEPFVDFINLTLRFNVTCHDDNNSYSFEGYDAIIISDSIAVDQISSLANAKIPILIMESFTWPDFRIASGRGSVWGSDYYIMNSNHYITLYETNGTYVTIYTSENEIQFLKGYNNEPPGTEIVSLARRTDGKDNERTLITLDKGKKDWNSVLTAERRTYWGATQGNILNQKGWELWNRTLRWILYDDVNGSAMININVKDLDDQDVPNAAVNLTLSNDISQKFSQNTTVDGLTTFANIPFGSYNLTVEFEDTINDTLSLLNITGQQTFNLTANFNFTVRIEEYVDNDPPIISNFGFFPSNKTFYADIFDASTLTLVNLSLSASNTSFTRNENYSMVTTDGVLYYNETAAQDLAAVNVTYNITAIDIAGNIRISDNYSFLLGDITPPIIQEYNVTDYKNGTLQFFANITDKQSDIQDPVILKINESFVEMHLNASGYWVYRTQAYYDITLNYTIWSANDSIGNENGTRLHSLTPKFGLTIPKDAIEPHIWGVSDTFTVHENGYVEFFSYIEDWNEYQSGTNISSIQLTLSVNGANSSHLMSPIGAITYYYEFTFNFEDTVYYWVNASDLAGNVNPGIIHGPFIINDNTIPIVSYWAEEWGNGTVDFHAEVIDWPNNETSVFVSYTQNWFDTPWPNKTMIEISESQFSVRENNHEFQIENIWYYVTAVDSSNNSYEPTLDESLNITITDKIPPIIIFTIENSILTDGEITVTAYAIDVFSVSNFVNNTFYVNMSSDSTTIETTMDYNPILRNWFKTQNFLYGEEVNIVIGVHDDAENFGKCNKTIVIDDLAPPNIKRHGSTVYQNGTVTIWAEVVEGPFGSGLTEENSSVTIEVIYRSSLNATMEWNGSGNYYVYSLSGFVPADVPVYQIKATDRKLNANFTDFKPIYIRDLTPPICDDFDDDESILNHYTSHFNFWVNASDPFGTIAGVNLTINYSNGSQFWDPPFTVEMHYNGSLYVYSTDMIQNGFYNYSILIFDEAFNTILLNKTNQKTLDFQPAEILGSGVEYNISKPGETIFWVKIHDPFEDYNTTLSVYDDTNGNWILDETFMSSNETHEIYCLEIPYLHNYSYVIQVNDGGSLYYGPILIDNANQMPDPWRPVIEDTGTSQDNGTVTVWANISDWGSGIDEVHLYYQFISSVNGGGGSQTYDEVQMEFNGSLYVSVLTFNETGALNWFIEAHDEIGATSAEETEIIVAVSLPNPLASAIPDPLLIILIIIATVAIVIILLLGGGTIQRKRSVRYKRLKEIEDKLLVISNVYTILVSTEVGVPIYTITNIMYQKDQTLNDALSSLSVGIDTFLQSFQSDFIQQVQQEDLEVSETENGINIRMSVIEQHQVQVLIAATPTYRIFVFLREHPTKFTKEAFSRAIEDIEKRVSIQDLGIVDERVYGPQVEAILHQYFPLTLLEPFVIDALKLKVLDEGIKRGRSDVPLSSAGISSLKRLVVSHILSKGKEAQFDKIFNETIKKGTLLESRMLLYNDARNIMTKLLKIPPEQIYEALWIGCSPDVKIIIPQRI